jgi:hypothetical protein
MGCILVYVEEFSGRSLKVHVRMGQEELYVKMRDEERRSVLGGMPDGRP